MSNFFYSLISLIVALFFILLGAVAILIPWSDSIRSALTQFILEDTLAISLFGFTVLVTGIAIVAYILLGTRRRYYHIRSQNTIVDIDEAIVQQYLDAYWKDLFPNHEIPCRLVLKKNKFHISVDFPYLPIEEQRPFLDRINRELRQTFDQVLGYRDEFRISASFEHK